MRTKKYEVYDGDNLLGIFKSGEIARMIGVPSSYPGVYAAMGNVLYGRYRFIDISEEINILNKDWDETRLRMLASGR